MTPKLHRDFCTWAKPLMLHSSFYLELSVNAVANQSLGLQHIYKSCVHYYLWPVIVTYFNVTDQILTVHGVLRKFLVTFEQYTKY
jgi:hypothetical protein